MSTIQVSPYINFQGRARDALEFYQKVLGGDLDLRSVNEQGVAAPARPGERIMHGRLEIEGATIVGTDGQPAYPPTVGDNWAVALRGTDRGWLTKAFNALAEGGKLKGPLSPQPWGGDVGWLTDKFGISWMVEITKA